MGGGYKRPVVEKVRYWEEWYSRGNIVIILIVVRDGSCTCGEHSMSKVGFNYYNFLNYLDGPKWGHAPGTTIYHSSLLTRQNIKDIILTHYFIGLNEPLDAFAFVLEIQIKNMLAILQPDC